MSADTENAAVKLLHEVTLAVRRPGPLRDILQECTDSTVRRMDAVLARVWVVDLIENALILQASSGIYTHLDGAHGRVPMGALKIGGIAQQKRPHWTNSVLEDPRVDHAWAKGQGLVSFAGYPLVVRDELLGVLGLFFRRELNANELELIECLSGALALGIAYKRGRLEVANLAEALPQLVWSATPDGSATYFNSAWSEHTGLGACESHGEGWMEAIHPDEAERARAAWRRSVKTGERFEAELRIRGRDGAYRWFLARGIPLMSEGGRVARWFGTCTDIDDRRTSEERRVQQMLEESSQKRATEEELRRINEELRSIAYVSSHELQEPVITIKSYHNLLSVRYRDRLGDDAKQFIDECTKASDTIQKMVNDLWTYARINRPGITFEQVDFERALTSAVASLEAAIAESSAVLTNGPLPVLRAVNEQVTDLFRRLVENALKYRSSAPPRVHVSAERRGAEWLFAVKDNGIGIDKMASKDVFRLFHRLRERPGPAGSGMGLPICKKIVEHHGGTIWVDSEPGGGSTFCFTVRSDEKS
jgi:PAS domain S-box-containing protein